MPDPLIALGIAAAIAAVLSLFLWPERGVVARWQRARHLNQRVLTEDALKHIHKCEMRGQHPSVDSVAGALQISGDDTARLLANMEALGLLMLSDGALGLTPEGREAALHIIRAHRLWERYLADQTGYDEAEWHGQAERLEHALLPADVDALSARLGNPTHDPHGDPIPDASGNYVAHGGRPLHTLAVDTPARIVHIEDEPEVIYAQLLAEGLFPGMEVRLMESSPRRVRFWADGNEHVLAPTVAANVGVVPMESLAADALPAAEPGEQLTALRLGEQGTITGISPRCRGAERRRLMDLGILPGTAVTAELISPGGDPTAYRIRDALIALRREQASLIHITRLPEAVQ